MPTLAQLQDEPWWGREVVTTELDWCADELCRRTGRPRTAAGTKGDEDHLRGGHRSQEWILHSVWCTSRTYTVQSDLTAEQLRHIGALDFVPGVWGTTTNRTLMAAQTRRLVDAAKAGRLDGVREIIGTLDGRTVYAYRVTTGTTFTADDTHLEHWHLTLDRRRLTDWALMERIVTVALGEDDGMAAADDVIMGGRALDASGNPLSDTVSGGIVRVWLRRTLGHVPGPEATGDVDRRSLLDLVRTLVDRPPVEPAPVDVDALAEALQPYLEAAAEAAVRKVLGGVDEQSAG